METNLLESEKLGSNSTRLKHRGERKYIVILPLGKGNLLIILHYIVIKREFLSAILTATAMRGGGAAHQPFFLIATLLGKTRNLIFLAQIYRAYIIHFCFGMIRARKEQRRGEGRMVK
ncbi:hypothetical protein POPTR_002G092751v4 [Populus trichocarpa]|uniref:Uncharacterized protein n=1 Tax=Populus trichocarpa TaxID=3694 RepID=A0ACC0TDH0_POPTR|nr:hypothetical protein POPTR_002G092751v4 [Populus trichocarpa]